MAIGIKVLDRPIEQTSYVLIDELGLAVIPVVLGSGVPFFGTMTSSTKLELMECRPFPSGIVLLNYLVVRP